MKVGDGQAIAFERDQIGAAVCEQHHFGDAEVGEDLRADADIALLLARLPFAGADPAGEDHDHARAVLAHSLHGALERALARARLAEHVVEHRNRVDAGEGGLVGDHVALLEHIGLRARHAVAIGDHSPLAAIIRGESALAEAFDQVVVAHPVGDEIADRADLEVMLAGEGDQVVEPGHRPVLVHDLADHARGVEPGEARNVDRRLGVPGAHQRAAIARHQREDVSGRDEIIRALGRIDRDRDGARAVSRRNTGGHAFLRLDRDREGGLHRFLVVAAHGREAEVIDAVLGEREADQPAPMSGHEVDRLRGGHLRGDDKVALVLAVLIIDEDVHPPVARLVDDFINCGKNGPFIVGIKKHFELL